MRFVRHAARLAAILLGALPLGAGAPESAPRAQVPFNPPCQKTAAGCAGLPENFAEVSPGVLYRGSRASEDELKTIKGRYGIKTVVDLRFFAFDGKRVKRLGLAPVRIPNLATHAEDEDVGVFLRVATDPANQPVFVHCRYGADRTGLMIAAWRLLVQRPAPGDVEVERELRAFDFHGYQNVLRWIRRVEAKTPAERESYRAALLKKS